MKCLIRSDWADVYCSCFKDDGHTGAHVCDVCGRSWDDGGHRLPACYCDDCWEEEEA